VGRPVPAPGSEACLVGPLFYCVAFLLAFVSVPASVILCVLLSLSFALPQNAIR
jgi:hypothetical protein